LSLYVEGGEGMLCFFTPDLSPE